LQVVVIKLPPVEIVDVIVTVPDPLKVSTERVVPDTDCEPNCVVDVASVVMVPDVGQ